MFCLCCRLVQAILGWTPAPSSAAKGWSTQTSLLKNRGTVGTGRDLWRTSSPAPYCGYSESAAMSEQRCMGSVLSPPAGAQSWASSAVLCHPNRSLLCLGLVPCLISFVCCCCFVAVGIILWFAIQQAVVMLSKCTWSTSAGPTKQGEWCEKGVCPKLTWAMKYYLKGGVHPEQLQNGESCSTNYILKSSLQNCPLMIMLRDFWGFVLQVIEQF